MVREMAPLVPDACRLRYIIGVPYNWKADQILRSKRSTTARCEFGSSAFSHFTRQGKGPKLDASLILKQFVMEDGYAWDNFNPSIDNCNLYILLASKRIQSFSIPAQLLELGSIQETTSP